MKHSVWGGARLAPKAHQGTTVRFAVSTNKVPWAQSCRIRKTCQELDIPCASPRAVYVPGILWVLDKCFETGDTQTLVPRRPVFSPSCVNVNGDLRSMCCSDLVCKIG